LEEWGRLVGVSRGAIRERCRLVGVTPKDSLAFARLLRAVIVAPLLGWQIADVLNVSDTRTLKKLVERGGLSLTHACASPTVEAYLAGQHLVCQPRLLDELQEQLRDVVTPQPGVLRAGSHVKVRAASMGRK
jgi:hypothetical protein